MTIKKRIATLLLVLVVILAIGGELLLSLFAVKANAAVDIQSYDSSPIESDMANMEEAKYPANQFGECEVVGFMEYCYSENSAYSSVYGLYVYVYNPTEKPLIMREGVNKIHISDSFKEDGTQNGVSPYSLIYLDNTDNHRFYKFKIAESSEQYSVAKEYASRFNGRRRYELTELKIMHEGSAKYEEPGIDRIYEFSGYAAWCGEPSIAVSTLECQYYGGQSVHLQVYDTNYRFGHKGDNLYDDLQSVYFSLPNEYAQRWGDLTKITAEWYQYKTSPMFVTKDKDAYLALSDMVNKRINEKGQLIDENGNVLSKDVQTYWRVFWDESLRTEGLEITTHYHEFAKSYNPLCRPDLPGFDGFLNSYIFKLGGLNGDKDSWIYTSRLDWIFSITEEIESIDDYRVSSEKVKQYIEDYTNSFPNQDKILDKYASNLFERYDGDGYQEPKEITSEGFLNFVDTNENQNLWEKFWGINETVTTENYSPIQKIEKQYLVLTDEEFAEKFLVNKDDVEHIRSFVEESYENNQTPYLLRFAKTDYYSSKARFDYAEEDEFDISDIDGYVAQEYVFLNFDVLSLEYTSADGFTKTVVGVVADSIDIINGLTAPEDIIEEEEWWQKIMAILLLIVFLVIFWPLLSPLFTLFFVLLWDGVKFLVRFLIKGILWVITLPFRIIGWFLK